MFVTIPGQRQRIKTEAEISGFRSNRSAWFEPVLVDLFEVPGRVRIIIDRAVFNASSVVSRSTFMDIRNLLQAAAFITKDGSEIRELLAHRNSCIRKQSLAEARVEPGAKTAAHFHRQTEEIYYVLNGSGTMTIDDEQRQVGPGDAIAIPPGVVHQILNSGSTPLVFLCCCAPGYEHDDTVIVA
jgi:mannose-6-phosphate isomerase-like protein (cupin superfamily)